VKENLRFPQSIPESDRGLTRGQIMVAAWMRSHRDEITAAELRFGVTRQAIAGVIAWEGLENIAPLSVRSVGPGKVHICNMSTAACETALLRFCGPPGSKCPDSVKGIDETVGQEVETLGYLPPRSLQQRIDALGTTAGAITYIGAILRAGADAAREAGWDIDRDPAKLAEFYRGYTLRQWRLALESVPRDSERLVLRDRNGNEIVDAMGIWIERNRTYLESAVGASWLRPHGREESILDSVPADSAQASRNAQARNDDYESWLRRLEATVSRIEEAQRQEKAELEFRRELVRQAGTFGYLATAAGLACSDPGAFAAEIRKGRYGSVGMERQYLSAYLAALPGDTALSPCQLEVLKRINDASGPVTWRELHAWAGEYRAAHPTALQRIDRALQDFLDAFSNFSSGGGGSGRSGESDRERPERERPERHSPDPLNTPSGRQLRGIAGGGSFD
jgi:hypothetical protein